MDFKEVLEFEIKMINKRLSLLQTECEDKEFTNSVIQSIRKSLEFVEKVSKEC